MTAGADPQPPQDPPQQPRSHRRVLLWIAVCAAFALAPFFVLAILNGGVWLAGMAVLIGLAAVWLLVDVLTRGRWPGWYEKIWDRTYGNRPRP